MSVKIIIGAPGSGKTEDIYKSLIESADKHPEKKHIVLTPEQNTLLTEKRLLSMNPKHILFNIDVLSFNRLSYLIFEKAGIGDQNVIGETGKSMLLRRILAKNIDSINYYSGNIHKEGFVRKLKVMISELIMYGITPEDFEEYLNADQINSNDSLKAKIKDLSLILKLFKEVRDEKSLTSEELLPKALTYVDKTDIFNDTYIVLDGYIGFTPVQYEFIKAIANRCSDVIFSVDIPSTENVFSSFEKHELFYPAKNTIKKIQDNFSEIGINVAVEKHEDTSRVSRHEAFTHLSNNFLRDDITKLSVSDDIEDFPISIWSVLNPVKEAEFIAHEINKLVKDGKLKYRDIAVVTGDIDNLGSVLKETFLKEGIPAYIDTKDSITYNPLCIFVLSLLEVVEKSFKQETVLRHAKTSLANIDMPSLDILENYAIATGINGYKKWSEDFTKNSYRNHENIDLVSLNKSRDELIRPLVSFREDFKKSKTISDAIDAINKVFDECNIKEKLEALAKESYSRKEFIESSVFEQIYDVTCSILAELKSLLGDEKRPSAKELREIIKSGIEEYAIGSLPPSIDEVHIGDIKRSRRGYTKVMFIASFNDGIVPSAAAGGGILNDIDRETLEDIGAILAPSSKQTSFDEQYTIYQLISAPTQKLYISFDRLSLSNNDLNPSSYLEYIREPFDNLKINYYDGYEFESISNIYEAKNYLASNLDKTDKIHLNDKLSTIFSSLKGKEDRLLKLIYDAAFFNYQGEKLLPEITEEKYKDGFSGSVSILETMAGCSYRCFLNYFLKLRERQELEFTSFDMGNYYHKVLESTIEGIIKTGKAYCEITGEEYDKIINDSIEKSVDQIKSYDIFETGKGEYFLGRWKRIIRRTAEAMIRNISQEEFKPEFVEKTFNNENVPSLNIDLANGKTMSMSGKIDRVDLRNNDGDIDFKIVDYKSYDAKLDKNLVDAGIQLQLITYMNAMEEVLRDAYPGKNVNKFGVGYFHIEQKYADAKDVDDDISDKVDNKYKYSLKEDELDELSELVTRRNKEIADGLTSGDISKNPYLHDKKSSCDNCPYKDMCDFDPRLKGYIRRVVAYKDIEGGDNNNEV